MVLENAKRWTANKVLRRSKIFPKIPRPLVRRFSEASITSGEVSRTRQEQIVSPSTSERAVRRVTPVNIPRGGVQNTSRKKALLDPRNALSYAATWNAVVDGIDDSRQIHSWDELSLELNGRLYMTKKASKVTRKRNLTPAATRNQGKHRTFKMGISKFVDILHHIAKVYELITNNLSTKPEGEVECVIAMIKDDNFEELKSYKVKQIHYL